MPALTDTLTMTNGVEITRIGLGTWQIPDGPVTYDSVAAALAAGYRHIDTARAYQNEESVARAITDSGLARSEVFVTTKLPAEAKSYDRAMGSFNKSMRLLGMDYVDLYLIHAPWPWADRGTDCTEGNAEAWRALEDIYESGRARSIGVSNFEVSHLEALAKTARITPHVNQIQFYVGCNQPETTTYCKSAGIVVEAYSPLATGKILDDPDLKVMADKYGKTVAQLAIAYTLAKGTVTLPKSTTPRRIVENTDVDFAIDPDDLQVLDNLTTV